MQAETAWTLKSSKRDANRTSSSSYSISKIADNLLLSKQTTYLNSDAADLTEKWKMNSLQCCCLPSRCHLQFLKKVLSSAGASDIILHKLEWRHGTRLVSGCVDVPSLPFHLKEKGSATGTLPKFGHWVNHPPPVYELRLQHFVFNYFHYREAFLCSKLTFFCFICLIVYQTSWYCAIARVDMKNLAGSVSARINQTSSGCVQ